MSYILDALRKADAEREQGRVPGLHSQLHPLSSATESPPVGEQPSVVASARPWGIVLVAGAVGAAVAAVLLWMARSDPPAAPAAVVTVPAPGPGTEAPPAPVQAPPAAIQAAPQLPAVEPTPAPDVALATPTPPPPRPAATPVDTAPPKGEVQALSALPDSVRRSLPPLVFGGAMHSDNAASRMLVINNNVYREGAEPAPGLVLEEIRLKSAVFRFQGQRFSVNY